MNADETADGASTIREIRDALGISVLLVEHDMGLVMGIADRVTVLDFGRRIADGDPGRGAARPRGDPRLPRDRRRTRGGSGGRTFVTAVVLNGLSLGRGLRADRLGFVIIFKATEVVNFAHGSLLLLGGYIDRRHGRRARLPARRGPVGIAAAGVARCSSSGCSGSRSRNADVIALAILTIGVDIVISTELIRRIGTDILNIGAPVGRPTVRVGDVGITPTAVAMIVAAS